MPPQHQRALSGASQNGNQKQKALKAARPVSTGPLPPNQKPDLGMSATSRYDHNLKVLRRRDPSITTIFDQFSHVCVYHFNINTNKWEKLGYEGSMFLYERNEYPPYGFYVLNRAGMDDYIQRMHADDDIGEVGGYVMLRSYPVFTERRIAKVKEDHPDDLTPFSEAYRIPSPFPTKAEKEQDNFKTVGLWVFASDAREPLRDVMYRLHSYIKKNERYPDEYRYGPGRPPPPNPHLRTTPAFPNTTASSTARPPTLTTAQHGPTPEFNKLLAKLDHSAGTQSTPSKRTKIVETLFATAGKTPHPSNTTPPQTPTTGIPLLDCIFASAGPSRLQPPEQAEPIIYSPKPTSSTLPQILNQDVIANLLGLPSSRSSSTNSFSSSREADCEDYSESSTVLDMEAELDDAGASSGQQIMSPEFSAGSLGHRAPVNGDVTPRALGPSLSIAAPPMMEESKTLRPTSQQALLVPLNDKSNGRRLVPFDDADTQLWPYPRAPIDEDEDELVELDFNDTSALSDEETFQRKQIRAKQRAADDGTSESDVCYKKSKRGGNRRKRDAQERQEIERGWDLPEAIVVPSPGPVPAQAAVESPSTARPLVVQALSTAKPHLNGKAKAFTNGHAHSTSSSSALDSATLQQSIIDTFHSSEPPMEKNVFIREVLTLIHTDKTFADTLWKDYYSRTS